MGLIYNNRDIDVVLNGNGIRSVRVEHTPPFILSESDISYVHVPGRNGDIIYDDGSYRNVIINYDIVIQGPVFREHGLATPFLSFTQDKLAEWLYPPNMPAKGYAVLIDDYDNAHYRLARANGPFQLQTIYGTNARGRVSFNCRPERYYREPVIYDFTGTSGTIDNSPYSFPAFPEIDVTVNGSGAFAIYRTGGNLYRVAIADVNGTIHLDCERQEATFEDGTSANSHVTLTGVGSYPILEPWATQMFAMTGNVTEVMIEARYYSL